MDKHTYTRASTVNEEGDQRLQMKEALLLSLSFSLLWKKKWISTMKRETAMARIHGIGFLPQLFP